MVHGDDWKIGGPDKDQRSKTIKTLKKIKAKLIEIPYTKTYQAPQYMKDSMNKV